MMIFSGGWSVYSPFVYSHGLSVAFSNAYFCGMEWCYVLLCYEIIVSLPSDDQCHCQSIRKPWIHQQIPANRVSFLFYTSPVASFSPRTPFRCLSTANIVDRSSAMCSRSAHSPNRVEYVSRESYRFCWESIRSASARTFSVSPEPMDAICCVCTDWRRHVRPQSDRNFVLNDDTNWWTICWLRISWFRRR